MIDAIAMPQSGSLNPDGPASSSAAVCAGISCGTLATDFAETLGRDSAERRVTGKGELMDILLAVKMRAADPRGET